MSKISSIFLLFIIATIPLLFGAVQPSVWSVYAVMIFCIFLIHLWPGSPDFDFFKRPLLVLSVGFFIVYTLFLCLPLPPEILELLSPHRYQLLKAKTEILNSGTFAWQSIAYSPITAFSHWILIVSLCLFAAMLYKRIQRSGFMEQMIWLMMGVAFLESMYGLVQVMIPNVGALWVSDRGCIDCARGTFINRNHFAGFLEMIWPLGLGFIIFQGSNERRQMNGRYPVKRMKYLLSSDWFGKQVFLAFLMVLVTLSLLFSKSRAGITGAMLGFAAFIIFSYLGKRRLGAIVWSMTAMGLLILTVYCSMIGFESVIDRFLMLADGNSRILVWEASFEIVKHHSMGIGLGNFEHVFPVYDSLTGIDAQYLYAHNDYLQLLIESGWPGFLLIIPGFFFFLGKSIMAIVKSGHKIDDFHFFIGIGALSGLISLAFHSVFDFNLQIPSNVLYFVVLMVLVDVCLGKGKVLSD